MTWLAFDPVAAVLLVPLGAAALLALLPGYRVTARINLGAALLTVSLLVFTNLASLVLEGFWAAIAIFGLAKALRAARAKS